MISLCIIVKNEEKLLREFLEWHKNLYDELVVVDTGSTDNTKVIAKEFTSLVFDFTWNDDFSSARNFSISKATKEWILWLDPDERIAKKDFEEIRNPSREKDGYSFIEKISTKNTSHPRYMNGHYIRRMCKLFKNNMGIRFMYPVHETVIKFISNIGKTGIVIEHKPEESKQKSEYYIKLLEKKKKEFPESNWEKEIKFEESFLESL